MLTTGTILQNRYRIVSLLGQGGMGAVYRAWHLSLNAPVAIKEMIPQPDLDAQTLAQLRRQFQQEAQVLARLSHPHLVRVGDFFEDRGNAYLVMDFVEGESLAERIAREGALPEEQVLAWAGQLLDALAYCHSQGIIHRDVKPHNVIIRPTGHAPSRSGGAGGGAVLVDFGLVKLWDPRDPRTKTAIRGMGTPKYAPPEQYGVQPGHTDPRSDVYSLGATLYHALTGQAPPTASDRMAFPSQFVPVRGLNARVSGETEATVRRAMELAVENRFPTAGDMAAALVGGAPAPAAAKRKPTKVMPGAQPAAPVRRKPVPAWAWALGAVATVAVLALVLEAVGGGATAPALPTAPPAPTAAPTTTPSGPSLGDTWTRPADGMVMVYVPAGEFEMGSMEGEDNEQPVHTVAVDGFWIDQTDVTNAQFALCVAAGACDPPAKSRSYTHGSYYGNSAYDGYPVIYVSWRQAADYCEWAGGRLPAEAEWEYAARGSDGRTYPWGNSAPDCGKANYSGCVGDTTAVGSCPAGASWCGAQDLAGNVWEWVADWYESDYYSVSPYSNPPGPASGTSKVLRGGGWPHYWYAVRVAVRNDNNPVRRITTL